MTSEKEDGQVTSTTDDVVDNDELMDFSNGLHVDDSADTRQSDADDVSDSELEMDLGQCNNGDEPTPDEAQSPKSSLGPPQQSISEGMAEVERETPLSPQQSPPPPQSPVVQCDAMESGLVIANTPESPPAQVPNSYLQPHSPETTNRLQMDIAAPTEKEGIQSPQSADGESPKSPIQDSPKSQPVPEEPMPVIDEVEGKQTSPGETNPLEMSVDTVPEVMNSEEAKVESPECSEVDGRVGVEGAETVEQPVSSNSAEQTPAPPHEPTTVLASAAPAGGKEKDKDLEEFSEEEKDYEELENKKSKLLKKLEEVDPEDLEDGEIADEEEEEVEEVPKKPEKKKEREKPGKEKEKEKEKEKKAEKEAKKEKKKKRRHSEEEKEKEKEKSSSKKKRRSREDELEQDFVFVRGASPPKVFETEINTDFRFPAEEEEFGDERRRRRSPHRGSGRRREEPPPPPPSSRRSRRPPKDEKKSDVICAYFMQGKCQKSSDDCSFSHDAVPPRKMELCKFWMMECCAKKEKCLYLHNDFPCKYYHTGLVCKMGDRCKFSHNPLSEVTKSVLLKHIETAPKEILGDFPRLNRNGALNLINKMESKINGTMEQERIKAERERDDHPRRTRWEQPTRDDHEKLHELMEEAGISGFYKDTLDDSPEYQMSPPHGQMNQGPHHQMSPQRGHNHPQGPPHNQMNPHGPPHNQMSQQGPPHNQMNQQGPPHSQMNQQGPPHSQMGQQGPPPHNQMNQQGPPHNQMNQQGPPHNQMSQQGPPHNQMNQQGPPHNQMNMQGPPHNQMNPQGPLNPMNAGGPLSQMNAQGPLNPLNAAPLPGQLLPGQLQLPGQLLPGQMPPMNMPLTLPNQMLPMGLMGNYQPAIPPQLVNNPALANVLATLNIPSTTIVKTEEELKEPPELEHLPKMQRDLFLRIQQQQIKSEQKEEDISDDEKGTGWYSSDEESDRKKENPDFSSVLSAIRQSVKPEERKKSSPPRGDVDLRYNNSNLFGDTDFRLPPLRPEFNDVDLRGSPNNQQSVFKSAPVVPATEIKAGFDSHPPLTYKLTLIRGLSKPDYSQVRLTMAPSMIVMDPRLGPRKDASAQLPAPASPPQSTLGSVNLPVPNIPSDILVDPRTRRNNFGSESRSQNNANQPLWQPSQELNPVLAAQFVQAAAFGNFPNDFAMRGQHPQQQPQRFPSAPASSWERYNQQQSGNLTPPI